MNDKALEIKVGFFLLTGLAIVAALAVAFGRMGEAFESNYTLYVTFPNASGLLKGSTVYCAGAKIGRVSDHPKILGEGTMIEVPLQIYDRIKLRDNVRIIIGTSGLLGDRFVDIQPSHSPDTPERPYLQDGARVEGTRAAGISDLTEGSKPLLDRANTIAQQLEELLKKINQDVLTQDSSQDLRESLGKLNSVLTHADSLLSQAQKGKGPVGRMLSDEKMADDLAAFIKSLREKGPVFYSDTSADGERKKDPDRDERRSPLLPQRR